MRFRSPILVLIALGALALPVAATAESSSGLAAVVAARLDRALPNAASTLRVDVSGGVVTLAGSVASLAEREKALAVAGEIRGVAAVLDRTSLRSNPRGGAGLHDDIASTLANYTLRQTFDWVEATPNGDTVVLTGKVLLPWHRDALVARLSEVDGLAAIDDRIEVLPASIFDDEIRRQAARQLFGTTAFVEYRGHGNPPIHILVENGRVTLVGRLSSAVEARRAQDLVTFGTAAMSVDNQIEVARGESVTRPFARSTT